MKTIYVSIASYRDKMCLPTLQSLFKNAKLPQRVFIGICEQNDVDDTPCFDEKYKNNVKVIKLSHKDAKGPAYARYLCSQLYNDQDYYFQIDSHCLFVKDWDSKLIDMIEMLIEQNISKKPLLSTYPREYEDYTREPSDNSEITMITRAFINSDNIVSFYGADFVSPPEIPEKSYFIAAGFLFAPAAFIKQVPFDPFLDNLFVGEEILLTMRAFTHGWDVFTPNKNIMYHLYTRSDQPKFWDDNYKQPTEAQMKVRMLTNINENFTPVSRSLELYGLGKDRTKEEFYQNIKLDKSENPRSESNLIFIISLIFLFILFICVVIYTLILRN